MGWISSVLGTDKSEDPLGKLDPKLREFLEKESPVKYSATQHSSHTTASQPQSHGNGDAPVAEAGAQGPSVPSASLFQDGRYADIWKTYRPLAQIEAETASDHDKLMSVLEGYKERKEAIGRAALENCAESQEEWVNCMKHGSWDDQIQMCRIQVRKFERCYTMQAVRLLMPRPKQRMSRSANESRSDSSVPWDMDQCQGDQLWWRRTFRCTPTRSTNG